VRYLLANGPIKLEDLANSEDVSTRTMQKYLHQLNEQLGEVAEIRINQSGYFLHILDYRGFSKIQSGSLKQDIDNNDQQKRQAEILLRLILTPGYVATDELAESFAVSRGTLLKDIQHIRSWLGEYRLEIVGTTSRGIKLEVDSAAELIMLIYNRLFDYVRSTFAISEPLSVAIEQVFDGAGIKNQTVQIFIKIVRIVATLKQYGLVVTTLSPQYDNLVHVKGPFSQAVVLVESAYHLKFSPEEIDFLAFPFNLYTNQLLDKERLAVRCENNQRMFMAIAGEIQQQVETRIDYDRFYRQIQYHLIFLINRGIFHVSPSDYVTDKMLQRFQLAADLAGLMVQKLSDKLQITIADVEVNYLTVYFQMALEEDDLAQADSPAVGFLSSMGSSIKQYLQNQLNTMFESQVTVVTYASESEVMAAQTHLTMLFTDHPPTHQFAIPVVMVGDIFRDRVFELKVKTATIQYEIDAGRVLWNVTAFQVGDYEDYRDILTRATQLDIAGGEVAADFTDNLLKHESVTKFTLDNGIAIPHAIATTKGNQLLLHLCRLAHPVVIENVPVTFIFIIGIPRVLSEQTVRTLAILYDLLFLIAVNETAIMNLNKVVDRNGSLVSVMEGL
jgi:transcriptional antiterminator/mannitol/fructose-specific phosphotransferase system IIA component (Ntr-type)